MKILPVGAELFYAYGQTGRRTDMTKLIVAFRIFANALKSSTFCPHSAFLCFVWISKQSHNLPLQH